MSKAINNPESLNVHAMKLQEVAWFIGEREYLKSPDWDEDSDRLSVLLSALIVMRSKGADNPMELAALHITTDMDEEDINVKRLAEVRRIIPVLLDVDRARTGPLSNLLRRAAKLTPDQIDELAIAEGDSCPLEVSA